MKILFLGTPEFAIPSLHKINNFYEIVGVVTQPDKPQGRHLKLTPPPVKIEAEKLGIPIFQPEKINTAECVKKFTELQPDLGVVVAYGKFLKKDILTIPKTNLFINLHPSLLPKWRGPSPIQTAVIEGDEETGVTVMKITEKMDAGDILLQKRIPIDPDETAEELSKRLSIEGADLLLESIKLIENGRATFTPQDETKATYCTMIEKKRGKIDWSWDAKRIHNLVRGCIPWPVAYTKLKGEIIRIHKTKILVTENSNEALNIVEPGTIVEVCKEYGVVKTGSGLIGVCVLQSPGRKPLPFSEYIKGKPIRVGEKFEVIENDTG
ncbi:MAG: methionyl-tRNA formyltransferase [Candidatus Hydrogenedentes bacterium]|nr:methionyl-tRNA formyltransferase [Candidatus Hydrogenedentota bacterium]